eukprot:TRINITY_DN17304_c0_g1_i1.p1 TRINITY_DN17304_c0_g1~~TRINITY_DN17304_c0_g1_i1.p1  ORF type:complete len:339 (-),score=26.47 TRINITY_DN17304_c0_g1_i1:751-1767(-)
MSVLSSQLRVHSSNIRRCELSTPWRPFLLGSVGRRTIVFSRRRRIPSRHIVRQCAASRDPPSDEVSANNFEDGSPGSSYGNNFCIIEGRDTVQDFARMQLQEIRDGISGRRNRIFLLMEEVRRLRIQQRIKSKELNVADEEVEEVPEYPSSIPFLPPLTTDTLDQYYVLYFTMVAAIILFGGLLAPALELRLGIGGTSYEDFIRSVHLPSQLSQVDPIVASFAGGAVGVISALLLVEVNNVKQQGHKRCRYCRGSGYLTCARCSGTGTLSPETVAGESSDALAASTNSSSSSSSPRVINQGLERCPNCAGSAKVMCPTCLCTGMTLATEHDPRIDPFD